ncbi:hypothetical protein E3226_004155 [Legionella geestiana]|uniref:hypothetical protein n=1 Tax=Legionella geestiana TaxID=45065 RepID=UPI001092DCBB|nr:hypothetical protein [Legionella geestiana]QDQ39649.1 hypothetical protein E3226_004155 [Legionella geestiana]
MFFRDDYRVAIFTFDHTLCKKPTFYFFKNLCVDFDESRKHSPLLHFTFQQSDYEKGKKDATDFLKADASSWFLHNEDYISAIATFHSFPDYIAGFLATMLGKELKRLDTHTVAPTENHLIASYEVEGVSRPVLIAYINPLVDRQLAITSDNWKSEQLSDLRGVLLKNNWLRDDESVHFYEGVCRNSECGLMDCGVPSELGYRPKYSQLALERNASFRAASGAVTVHRVRHGKHFEADLTADEQEAMYWARAGTAEPSRLPPSSSSASSHPVRTTLLLAGFGVFATAAAFGVCAMLGGEKETIQPHTL